MDILFLVVGLIGVLGFCYVVIERMNRQLSDAIHSQNTTLTTALSSINSNANTFLEQLAKMEQKHWEQLEKQSSKQLQILEKQTKDFMQVMSDFIEASKQPPPVLPTPDLLDNPSGIENTIEREEVSESNLEDIPRIPLIDGVNVQFEGEEEIHPIDIS